MRLWLTAALAGLLVGVLVPAAVLIVRYTDFNTAAAVAAMVATAVALIGGLWRWVAGGDRPRVERRRATVAIIASGTAGAVAAAALLYWVYRPTPTDPICAKASGTLRVLAGHSLYGDGDLRSILDGAADAVGVKIELGDQEGTLAATFRRPVTNGVADPPGADPTVPPDLAFPADLATANALLFDFRDKFRKPSRTIYVLDVSGSMCWPPQGRQGDPCAAKGNRRIDGLIAALKGLAGADPTVPFADQVAEFSRREQVILLPFRDDPEPARTFDMQDQANRQRVQAEADGLIPGGGTGLYEALMRAYNLAGQLMHDDPHRITNIVLLTDGEATGKVYPDFDKFYQGLKGTPEHGVPTFTVAFGEAKVAEMKQVALLTNGLFNDAQVDSLTTAFFKIRGYV